MKTTPEMIEELKAGFDARVAALELRIVAMEEDDKKDDEEEAKRKAAEEEQKKKDDEESARKAAEDEKKEESHAKQISDMAAEIAALKTTLAAPGVAAAVKAVATGSDNAAGEGGQESGAVGKMTASEALAAYNKIDANDAKARAEFRTAHAAELGLKRR
jgi:hypothetical protein